MKHQLLNERGFTVRRFNKVVERKGFRADGNAMSAANQTRYEVTCKSGKVVFTGTHKAFCKFVERIDINGTYEQDLDF